MIHLVFLLFSLFVFRPLHELVVCLIGFYDLFVVLALLCRCSYFSSLTRMDLTRT